MMQLSSKNDDSSLYYDVNIKHQKLLKLTNLVIFRVILIIIVAQMYLEMLSPLLLINATPRARRAPPADTKCPPAASMQSTLVYIHIHTNRTKVFVHYILPHTNSTKLIFS